MSKTLSHILTVFKVARIIAKVVFILCIIGFAGCIIGLVTLPTVGALLSAKVFVMEGFDLPSSYVGCMVGAVACAGEVIFAFMAERYFKNVLSAGTPFTFDGAKESFRLGLASIIISLATSVIAAIISFIFILLTSTTNIDADINMSVSLSTGLFFLFMSLIFKHGAELKAACDEKIQQEAQQEAPKEEPTSESEPQE